MELLVIGADGADPRLLSYFLNKGRMPNIETLLQDTAEVKPMASRFSGNRVPHTGPAWTTIYTGLTAEQHGVTEDGWTDGLISLEPHFDHTVFAELMDNGLSVGAMTMAITYPAQVSNDDSWMVSGYPSTGEKSRLAAPSAKLDHLPSDLEGLQAKTLVAGDISPPSAWREAEQRKVREILPAMASSEEDVLFYGTQITDTMGHRARYRPFYLNGGISLLTQKVNNLLSTSLQPPRLGTIAWTEEMRIAYETLDWIVGELVQEYDPEDLLLVSDHGFELIGADHSYTGISLATDSVERPETIIEVKDAILERFGIEFSHTQATVDRPEQELSSDESEQVFDQLEALGYR